MEPNRQDHLNAALGTYAAEYRLSRQERTLLCCAIRGVSDKLAADEMGCSRNTVGTYWQRIYRKTGVHPQRSVLAHMLRTVLDES